jgi:predicted HTH domain antitoxin
MVEEQVTISARIQKSQAKEVERLAAMRGVDRSTVIRELLSMALREQKLKEALDLVRAKKVTVWRAAETAGVTYREMLGLLKMHNIPFPLSEEELKREAEEILGRQ